MSDLEDVRGALEAVLTGTLAIPSADIAWKGKAFNVATRTTPWYRPTFIPGIPRAAGVGSVAANEYVFIFQIDVFYPANSGEATVAARAQVIAAQYKRGVGLTRNGQIVTCKQAYRGTTDDSDPKWIKVPVVVEGWAHVPN